MSKHAVEVDTREFHFAHGRQPKGPGTWAFFFGKSRDVSDAFFVSGTWRECASEARDEARRRGVRRVVVGS